MDREELAGLVCNTIGNGLRRNPTFGWRWAADCFCANSHSGTRLDFNRLILDAIEEALATVEFPPQEDFDA
jgi:hypothetical protein